MNKSRVCHLRSLHTIWQRAKLHVAFVQIP